MQLISPVTQRDCCMLWGMPVDLTMVLTDAGVGAWWCFKHMTCSIGSANQRCIGGAAPRPGSSALLAAAVLRGSGAAAVVLRRLGAPVAVLVLRRVLHRSGAAVQ